MHDTAALSRADSDLSPRRRPQRWRRTLWRVLTRLSRLRVAAPGLLDRYSLLAAGNRLQRGSRRDAAVLLFDFEDLPELSALYGDSARRDAVRQVAQELQRVAGEQGLAARTGASQFTLLLPDCSRQEAIARAVRELGTPCRIELDLDGGEAVLVPDVLAEDFPKVGGGLAMLQRRLGERLAAHRLHRRQRDEYLRRSRERYSRPAPL
jgi:GGDEF domain-containing protein